MKYKLICFKDTSGGGNPDGSASFTFYTLSQGTNAGQSWASASQYHYAYLWDGSSWRLYS